MSSGYKLIIEQIEEKNDSELRSTISPIASQRIIHYFTHIITRSYQLYTTAPKGIWKELYLIYQYADKNQFLKKEGLGDDYKHTLLLAASFPYQWRQSEQESIYKAAESWISLTSIRNDLPSNTEPGYLVIDSARDEPPLSNARGVTPFSPHCKVLDVSQIIDRLKSLLKAIAPNELQARIAHNNEPEYGVSTSVLRGLIKEWGTPISRIEDRIERSEPVKICIGLMATHYFINGRRPFQSVQQNIESDPNESLTLDMPTLGLQGDIIMSAPTDIDDVEKPTAYPTYPCTLINETSSGFGLRWPDDSYPPIQAGEVIGLERNQDGVIIWEVCKIRWLQHITQGEFRIGIERLAKEAKAGGAQLIKEGQQAGYSLRCLLLGSSILLPTLPFKTGSLISVTQDNEAKPREFTLTQVIDATGSYKRFQFNEMKVVSEESSANTTTPTSPETTQPEPKKEVEKPKPDDSFDSIWSNL